MGLKGASFLMVNWLEVHLLLTDKFLPAGKFLTAGGGWYLMEKWSGQEINTTDATNMFITIKCD